MKQQEQTQIENAFKVLEKEGNKVSRDGVLPAGKNADAGHDIASFNAGFRYAMSRMKTSMKQIQDGKYTLVDFPRQGQHALPTAKTAPVKKAVAKKASAPKAAAATAAKKVTPKPVAKKAAPAPAKAPTLKETLAANGITEQPDAPIVNINTAKKISRPKTIKKIAKRA